MIEVLQFIFSSFWIWLGCLLFIVALGEAVCSIIRGDK